MISIININLYYVKISGFLSSGSLPSQLLSFLSNSQVIKVGQNINFDLACLAQSTGSDTFPGSHILPRRKALLKMNISDWLTFVPKFLVTNRMCLDNSSELSSIQISISLVGSISTCASKVVEFGWGMVGFRWQRSIPKSKFRNCITVEICP